MRARWFGLLLIMTSVSCQSLPQLEVSQSRVEAGKLWASGQTAMRAGQVRDAIGLYKQALQLDPGFTHSHLSLAAAYLEVGEEDRACQHLGHYLDANPDHAAVRSHYAELLYRLEKPKAARNEFERFDAEAQKRGESARADLIHCHSRLTKIAMSGADEYREHLHRGIGLYYLALERELLPDPEGELPTEGLLFQAAGELSIARAMRPHEARPSVYLYRVWTRLSRRQPALRALKHAGAEADFSFLTPVERRDLKLAELKEEPLR
ncbi:MAG: tetratricopeptide repeat protein [Gemmataceae bacterium]